MPASYRDDVILAPASALRPGEIDRLNELLHDAGLGRPLRQPEDSASEVTVLPVDGADPMAVRDALHRVARERGEDLPELTPDFQYAAHTVEDDAREQHGLFFDADGKRTGHGMMGWLPAPRYAMPPAPEWQRGRRHPVVALLDTRVEAHPWLPQQTEADPDPFLLDASGWDPPRRIEELAMDHLGSHRGHGTFVTGLIRLAAPDACVLPVRVMADDGLVSNHNLVEALKWVADYNRDQRRVDVVCMAFGRPWPADDPDLKKVRDALRHLSDQRVKVVASVGNEGSEEPNYPAAFATDPDLSVVSVGARRSATERAPYSNYGVWVREWGEGTNVISLMPMTSSQTDTNKGYAWWSGTSFAAATFSGEVAQHAEAHQTLPAGAATP